MSLKYVPIYQIPSFYFVLAFSLDSIAKCAYGIDTNTYKGEDNIYFRVAEAFFADIRVSDGVTSLLPINLKKSMSVIFA